ncbi:MAG: hypothetical protein II493_06505, partial [Spirochaetales bacterium]|nr:hypothetical protein [Spirochaetales bacterium]
IKYGDFNIYIDYENIKHTINNYNLGCDVSFFIDSMNKAAETLKALLKVRKNFVINKITDDNITELQIDYWNSSMIGSKANYLGDLGIDLIILARFEDSMAEDVLANAETVLTLPQAFEQPLLGLVNISTNADYSKKKSKEYFQSIILHEFIHILGFDIDNFTGSPETAARLHSMGVIISIGSRFSGSIGDIVKANPYTVPETDYESINEEEYQAVLRAQYARFSTALGLTAEEMQLRSARILCTMNPCIRNQMQP